MGTTLAMVKSLAEQRALGPKITQQTWIGLHRNPKDKSSWLWVDGTQANYTHWTKGEPNNVAEECGVMRNATDKWKWNDWTCTNSAHYVCEIEGWSEKILFDEIFWYVEVLKRVNS